MMIGLLIRLFGGQIAGKAATWIVTTVTLWVVQGIYLLGTHGFGWLVSGWDARAIAHTVLVAVVGATINHLGNLAQAGGNPAVRVLVETAEDIEAAPDAVLRAEAVHTEDTEGK